MLAVGGFHHRGYITTFSNFSQSKPPRPFTAFSFVAAGFYEHVGGGVQAAGNCGEVQYVGTLKRERGKVDHAGNVYQCGQRREKNSACGAVRRR